MTRIGPRVLNYLIAIVGLIPGLLHMSAADSATPSASEILTQMERAHNRRDLLLKQYTSTRQYTMHNLRFGKQADVTVSVTHREVEGELYTVLKRSGSDKLAGIIDKLLAFETGASLPPEYARYQMNSANYRARLLGTEVAAGRSCYVLELAPKIKSRYLITGKAWIDSGSYGVVRIEGRVAGSISILVGAPHIIEEYIEVQGFWLPGHVRSVASTFLLGLTELDIHYSDYQLDEASASPGESSPKAEISYTPPQSGRSQ